MKVTKLTTSIMNEVIKLTLIALTFFAFVVFLIWLLVKIPTCQQWETVGYEARTKAGNTYFLHEDLEIANTMYDGLIIAKRACKQ